MTFWDRQYRMSFGPAGGAGVTIGDPDPAYHMPLRISFDIEKADTQSPNTAKISVWNLSPEHLAMLGEKDCVVTLRAGYADLTTMLFVGTVTYAETQLDTVDRETKLELADGLVELRDTYVSLSYNGKINNKKMIEDVAAEMGVTLSFAYNAQFADVPNGFSCVSTARTALDKACAQSGLEWQIQNGILQIKNKGDVMTNEVFLLSSDSGLIGIPKSLKKNGDDNGKKDAVGWEVEYLLNGAIGIGDYIRLETKDVQGYYRIQSVKMKGDNFGNDWKCTAKLLEAE